MKEDLRKYLENDKYYFAENHLESWFAAKYLGMLKTEIKYILKHEHDDSGEIENAEEEMGRMLEYPEKQKVIKRFRKAVIKCIKFRRKVAIAYEDALLREKIY